MKNNRVYVLPIFTPMVNICELETIPGCSNSYVTEHRMKHYVIDRKINNIYKKIHNIRSLGETPTTIVLSQLDYEFINAFLKYNPGVFTELQANQVKGEYTLFGLKVCISDIKTPIVGWKT